MRRTQRISIRIVMTVLCSLSVCVLSAPMTAATAAAKQTEPIPVCAGAKDLLVDVTQDVRNDQSFLPARDGHMWARFAYTQHLRIWAVGVHQYCISKEYEGSWESIAGLSPGLTGTISDGLTGTFHGIEYLEWTGDLTPLAPTSGHLGEVDADCTDVDVCADYSYRIVNTYYFPGGSRHCSTVRASLDVDGGEHGRLSLTTLAPHRFSGVGDVTG